MGGMGEILGHSKHFEISFWVNLTLDNPRFYFDIDLIKNRKKNIEDDARIRDLFIQELTESWINYKGQKAKQIKWPSSWIILETDGFSLILELLKSENGDEYCCIRFTLKDQEGNVLDSIHSYDGKKESKAFDQLYTLVEKRL